MGHFISMTIIVASVIWVGILLLAFSGKLFGTLYAMIRTNKKRLEQYGVVANAVVLKIEKSASFTRTGSMIKLQVQVQPDKGRNFVVEIQKIPAGIDTSAMKMGSMVRVKYNPDNFKHLILL